MFFSIRNLFKFFIRFFYVNLFNHHFHLIFQLNVVFSLEFSFLQLLIFVLSHCSWQRGVAKFVGGFRIGTLLYFSTFPVYTNTIFVPGVFHRKWECCGRHIQNTEIGGNGKTNWQIFCHFDIIKCSSNL